MLLATIMEVKQAEYGDLQIQIEILQEKQRELQALLQRLGSVESKMESAAAALMSAIAEIKEVCPDQIEQYKEVINSLFDGEGAFPALPEVPEVPEVDPQVEVVEDEVTEVEVEDETDDLTQEYEHKIKAEWLSELPINVLRRIAKGHGVSGKGKRDAIANRLAPFLAIQEVQGLVWDQQEQVA